MATARSACSTPPSRFRLTHRAVRLQRLGDLRADAHHRVQRELRILQHHRDAAAPQRAALGGVQRSRSVAPKRSVSAVDEVPRARTGPGSPGRSATCPSPIRRRCPAARGPARRRRHARPRPGRRRGDGKPNAQVLDLEQGRTHAPAFGSSASRSPSPSRVEGQADDEDGKTRPRGDPPLVEHVGAAGGDHRTPTRASAAARRGRGKPRPAAVRMMPAMSSVTRTITEGRHSGITWRSTMRPGEAPISFTAEMKSAWRIVKVSARAIRA